MSTVWYPERDIPWDEFRRTVESHVRLHPAEKTFSCPHVCLTDGKAFLWAYSPNGRGTIFEAFGMNQGGLEGGPDFPIRQTIQRVFGTRLVSSEHGPYDCDLDEIDKRYHG